VIIDMDNFADGGDYWSFNSDTRVLTILDAAIGRVVQIDGAGITGPNAINGITMESNGGGVGFDLILNNVNVVTGIGPAFDMRGANVNLWLEGNNTLSATGSGFAGVRTTDGSLIINGSGALTANGGNGVVGGEGSGAGIGGNGTTGAGESGGTVLIESGTVMARGGGGGSNHNAIGIGGIGAGIGGGGGRTQGGAGGQVTISGGNVTATGGAGFPHNTGGNSACGVGGAGIGGGSGGVSGSIGGGGAIVIISGGVVTATGGSTGGCVGNRPGVGIGGGYGAATGGAGGSLTINGGIVTVSTNANTAAIGGGNGGHWGGVTGAGGTGAAVNVTGGLLEVRSGRISGGSNYGGIAGPSGTTAVNGGNLSIAVPGTVTDGDTPSNQIWRTEIFLFNSGGSQFTFPPHTAVEYILDGQTIEAVTDSRGRLFMYLPPGRADGTNSISTMTIAANPDLGLPGDLQGWLLVQNLNNLDALAFAQNISDIPPLISGQADRTGENSATVNFNCSNFAGDFYYIIRSNDDPSSPLAEELRNSPLRGNAAVGVNTFDIDSLTPGSYRVYLMLVNEHDSNSNILSMPISPYTITEPPQIDDQGGGLILQVGANSEDIMRVFIEDMSMSALGIASDNIATMQAASAAISSVSDAINRVSLQRADLGAYQNRLEYKIANLDNSTENLSAAESRIRDTDMAKEMTEFTKQNILTQATTAMLAQANALPQSILQLLG
jgi:flagellin-like hook-associated protein FlgL